MAKTMMTNWKLTIAIFGVKLIALTLAIVLNADMPVQLALASGIAGMGAIHAYQMGKQEDKV